MERSVNRKIVEPTYEEVNKKAIRILPDGSKEYCMWFPQLGGYHAKMVILVMPTEEEYANCIDAYVWHNGDFPFSEEPGYPVNPRELHICDAEQWIDFGKELYKIQYGEDYDVCDGV